jgi:1-acyl-sn-glycerol-3-phosphate acyltransferase
MKLAYSLVTGAIHVLTGILCRIDAEQLARVPARGPLILVANHVNFLEVPLIYTRLRPRPLTGFSKSETWDNWAMAKLMDLWDVIPLHRGEADVSALRAGIAALEEGKIVAVTPEGTRTGDGRLRPAHPGVAWLALHTGAPLMPMAFHGGEHFWTNIRRLRRTDFHIAVGEPFCLAPTGSRRVPRTTRREIADAIMARVAALLPERYHGVYAGSLPDLFHSPHLRSCNTGEA